MRVLVACESSHEVSGAFRARGHDAYSCDLLPADRVEDVPYHIQGDVLEVLSAREWDLVIAHPPCTYLCSSGLHWNKRRKADGSLLFPDRSTNTNAAAEFFMSFTKLDCKWCIENPIGCMSKRFRKPDQYVQPHEYGHDASKRTALWLNGLPPLQGTKDIAPRWVKNKKGGKDLPRWANQTDSGQNKLPPSKDRWKERSKTYRGIAEAMANQWG